MDIFWNLWKTYESVVAHGFCGFLKCIAKGEFLKRPTIMFMLDIIVGLF